MLWTSKPTSSATSRLTVSSRDSPGTHSLQSAGATALGRAWPPALTQLTEASQSAEHPWGEGRLSGQQAALSIRHQDNHHRGHLEPGHRPEDVLAPVPRPR